MVFCAEARRRCVPGLAAWAVYAVDEWGDAGWRRGGRWRETCDRRTNGVGD